MERSVCGCVLSLWRRAPSFLDTFSLRRGRRDPNGDRAGAPPTPNLTRIARRSTDDELASEPARRLTQRPCGIRRGGPRRQHGPHGGRTLGRGCPPLQFLGRRVLHGCEVPRDAAGAEDGARDAEIARRATVVRTARSRAPPRPPRPTDRTWLRRVLSRSELHHRMRLPRHPECVDRGGRVARARALPRRSRDLASRPFTLWSLTRQMHSRRPAGRWG